MNSVLPGPNPSARNFGRSNPDRETIPPSLDFGLLRYRSRQAQLTWEGRTPRERRSLLRAFHRHFVNNAETLAHRASESRQCSVAEVMATEIMPLADSARYLANSFAHLLAPKRLGKKGRPGWLTGVDCEVHRQPLGLILIISPGNYPLFLAAVQALQALAAGNAVWIKPAPGSTPVIRELRNQLIEAGFEMDLIQILPESVEATEAAIRAGVDKVIFTGSADTGRKILAQLAPRLTPSVMELSGCDAVFLRQDADLKLAAQAIRFGITLNRGRTCIAPKRIFVPRQLLGPFTRLLREELQSVPPIHLNADTCEPWIRHARSAVDNGAFVVSGTLHADRVDGPLILAGADPGMQLLQTDTFAPVASIVAVDSDSEALAADEACPFALSASVFGQDPAGAGRLASRVNAGSVVINDLIAPTADPRIPFGGVGQSGFGSTRGDDGLLEMTSPKVVITNRARHRMHYRPLKDSDTPLFQALLRLSHGATLIERVRALFSALSIFKNSNHNKTRSRS